MSKIHFAVMLILAILAFGCTRVPVGGSTSREEGSAVAASAAAAETRPGCIPPKLPADRAPDEAELASMRGTPRPPPLLHIGERVDSIDDPVLRALAPVDLRSTPDGLPLQARIFDATFDDAADAKVNQQLWAVYASAALGPDDTVLDVLRKGGAVFTQAGTYGQDAALVKSTIGDEATIVRIGDFDAALVESSTMPGVFRTHALYWSDGRRDFALRIGGSSEEVVRVAQALYCS